MSKTHQDQKILKIAKILLRAAEGDGEKTAPIRIKPVQFPKEPSTKEPSVKQPATKEPSEKERSFQSLQERKEFIKQYAEKRKLDDILPRHKEYGITKEDIDRIDSVTLTESEVEQYKKAYTAVRKKYLKMANLFLSLPDAYFDKSLEKNAAVSNNFRQLLANLESKLQKISSSMNIYGDLQNLRKQYEINSAVDEHYEELWESVDETFIAYNNVGRIFLKLMTQEDLESIVKILKKIREYLESLKNKLNPAALSRPEKPIERTMV